MKSTLAEPVRSSWKIHEVLRRYPELLDVLVATAPAFHHLKNPVMRRVQGRLVTVAEAARIAGIDAGELVQALNQAIGAETPPEELEPDGSPDSGSDQAVPAWVTSVVIAVHLDVRPLQRRGQEPFAAIMDALRNVPPRQALSLRNTFEPIPLYDLLSTRGFDHWSRQIAVDDWEVLFYNTGRAKPARRQPSAPSSAGNGALEWEAPTATITIDVSELVPPEPMIRILEALAELPAGGRLLVYHVRRPMHLYPRLDELGCRHETREPTPGRVELLIQKPAASDGDAR